MYLCYECIQLCENKIKIMTRIFVSIVFVIGLFLQTSANDVRIRGEAKVQALTETTALITFPLSWEHSWRDPESWDAVYLFVKYRRVGVNEPWHHAYLKNSGHRAAGGENVPARSFAGYYGRMECIEIRYALFWKLRTNPNECRSCCAGCVYIQKGAGKRRYRD